MDEFDYVLGVMVQITHSVCRCGTSQTRDMWVLSLRFHFQAVTLWPSPRGLTVQICRFVYMHLHVFLSAMGLGLTVLQILYQYLEF